MGEGVPYNRGMSRADPTQLDPDFHAYDLIGDVHGCADALFALLDGMGYRKVHGVWRHPERIALFTGDLIDRGPAVRETVLRVREMMDVDAARVVLGNHEYNLAGWFFQAPKDSGRAWLRPHTERNKCGLSETLEAFANHPGDLEATLAWIHAMPLWLESPRLRVIHACWDDALMARFLAGHDDRVLSSSLARVACYRGSLARRFLDRILNGTELELPEDRVMRGRDGLQRRFFRTAFWTRAAETLGDVAFQPDPLPDDIHTRALDEEARARVLSYPADAPPVFFGHYWRSGTPALQADNVCCLDYSMVLGGRLMAYRFDGERRLDPERFTWIERPPSL
ncbi:MAG: serine/threonine protein phosphatase [Gammaproteobacteria bacterium]|nr:MAG: serine/threonine protein phosphatase [Gammaproteobacteria bacterium]